jgi:hypothetical protein
MITRTVGEVAKTLFRLTKFSDYVNVGGDVFMEDYFIRKSTEYLDSVDTYDFNPGQNTIWYNDMKPSLETYCNTQGANFTVEGCLNYVISDIGDEKANALSETLAETIGVLEFIWDNAYGGDNYSDKWFLGRYFG